MADRKEGDRAAYLFSVGAHAEARILPADQLYTPPDNLDDQTVVAAFVRTMTAQYLLRRLYRVEAGETILVHSAAGGMGSLLTQWATSIGAKVIGTVSSPDKFLAAEENGCAHVIDYTREDFADAVLDITAEPATVTELDRQLGLNESVLRTKVLRKDVTRTPAPAAG